MDARRVFKDGIGMTKKYAFPLGTSVFFRYRVFFDGEKPSGKEDEYQVYVTCQKSGIQRL